MLQQLWVATLLCLVEKVSWPETTVVFQCSQWIWLRNLIFTSECCELRSERSQSQLLLDCHVLSPMKNGSSVSACPALLSCLHTFCNCAHVSHQAIKLCKKRSWQDSNWESEGDHLFWDVEVNGRNDKSHKASTVYLKLKTAILRFFFIIVVCQGMNEKCLQSDKALHKLGIHWLTTCVILHSMKLWCLFSRIGFCRIATFCLCLFI